MKTFHKNIQQFLIDNISDVPGYQEAETEQIKKHPKYDEKRWSAHFIDTHDEEYEEVVQEIITDAESSLIDEIKNLIKP